jgi:hypothetical protein
MRTEPVKKILSEDEEALQLGPQKKMQMILALIVGCISIYFFFFKILFF